MRDGSDAGHLTIATKDGEEVLLEYRNTLISDDEGHPNAVHGAARDVTDRVRAQEALKESEEKYRELVQYAPAGIYEFDLEAMRFISVNDVMCDYSGLYPGRVSGPRSVSAHRRRQPGDGGQGAPKRSSRRASPTRNRPSTRYGEKRPRILGPGQLKGILQEWGSGPIHVRRPRPDRYPGSAGREAQTRNPASECSKTGVPGNPGRRCGARSEQYPERHRQLPGIAADGSGARQPDAGPPAGNQGIRRKSR